MSSEKVQELAAKITKEMADRGCVIEGGFRALLILMGIKDVNEPGVDKLRRAYYGGAQHLFASIVGSLDPGTQETAAELRRMELIHDELEAWAKQEKAKNQ